MEKMKIISLKNPFLLDLYLELINKLSYKENTKQNNSMGEGLALPFRDKMIITMRKYET